jgi:alkanesulfonate monooxygenase SsuD/methylene tetrahydromethanopterin reductase-like flavin-dependent oxidoreductase (luciferase family)
VFVVGRGFRTREVETSGSPPIDQAANRELFEEQVEIIFEALDNDSFSHRGKYDTLPPAAPYRGDTLKEPTLAARLPVECWQPIQSGTALAGCHGETWDLGRDRRRLGPGRCDGQGHARMAGGARADRIEPRTGRADGHPVPVPYREIQGRRNERSG